MRRLFILVFLISTVVFNQTAVYADTDVAVNKDYLPLPYILSTYPANKDNQIDFSDITVDRGVFSYVLYQLINPNETLPPAVTAPLRAKYGYEKYRDKRFEPVMMDYTIWAMEFGYLTTIGRANHLLRIKWADIESLFAVLKIQPARVEDYSIYDTDNWGFITESEKETIGMFLAAFGRGIDTKSIEKQKFTLTVADMVYLINALRPE